MRERESHTDCIGFFSTTILLFSLSPFLLHFFYLLCLGTLLDRMRASSLPHQWPTLYTYSFLITRFGRKGDLDSVQYFVDRMQQEKIKPDAVFHNLMINTYLMWDRVPQVCRCGGACACVVIVCACYGARFFFSLAHTPAHTHSHTHSLSLTLSLTPSTHTLSLSSFFSPFTGTLIL